MNDQVIGTCSICGGPVSLPTVAWQVGPILARCERCGAVEKRAKGPVIPMEPRRSERFGDDGGSSFGPGLVPDDVRPPLERFRARVVWRRTRW